MIGWIVFFWSGVLAVTIYCTALYSMTKVPDQEGKAKEDKKAEKKGYLIGVIVGWIAVVVIPIILLLGKSYFEFD